MAAIKENQYYISFPRDGVAGLTQPDRNSEKEIKFNQLRLRRIKEYVRLAFPIKLEEGWSVIDFRNSYDIDNLFTKVILSKKGENKIETEFIEVPRAITNSNDVVKFFNEYKAQTKRAEKKALKYNKEQEELRAAEIKKLTEIEETERVLVELQAKLLKLKG